jgi:hypothetical protein
MQSIRLSIFETITTLVTDNLNNMIILTLAVYVYDVPIGTCLPLFIIANCLNAVTSYTRRRIFTRIEN